MITWDKICKPKAKGGLGLRKLEAVNEAFQCKLEWRILTNEPSLWVRAMQDKRLCKTSLLDYTSKGAESIVWRNVLRCKQLLRQGIWWKLGKGDKILFWLENHTLLEILSLHVDAISHPYAKVIEFITPLKRWDLYEPNQVIRNSTIIQQIR